MIIIYGEAFKKFRKSKGYTIKELTSSGLSESTITRFEKGETDLGIQHVHDLLHNMNTTLKDWIVTYCGDDVRKNNVDTKLTELYLNEDLPGLKHEYEMLSAAYAVNVNIGTFKQMTTVANLYFDLCGEQLLSKRLYSKFTDLIFAVDRWDAESLNYFGSSTAIMLDTQLLVVEKEILSQLEDIESRDFSTYEMAWTALLNGYLNLIERNVEFAKEVQPIIMSKGAVVDHAMTQIRRYMFNNLLNYKLADSETERLKVGSDIIRTISFLNDIGNKPMADQFMGLYTQICQ